MANHYSSSFRSSLKISLIILAAPLFLNPLAAYGESMTFVRTVATSQENLRVTDMEPLKKVRLTLDNEGNVMVRYGDVSCTLIYGASSVQRSKEHPVVLAPSGTQVASLGAICLKFGIPF